MRLARHHLSLQRFFRPGAAPGVALIALVVAALLFQGSSSPSAAAPNSAPQAQSAVPFLTLPFAPNAEMNILSGWYYSGSGGLHNGIDYINGSVSRHKSWKTFPILASADGEACGNCTSRQGNAVWVRHKVNGATYYTYYGHLSSISPDIPIGAQSRVVAVKRGQFIGMAGDTGSAGSVHLHFAFYTSGSRPMDPYGIGRLREAYPAPHAAQPGMAWFMAGPPPADTSAPVNAGPEEGVEQPANAEPPQQSDPQEKSDQSGDAGGGEDVGEGGLIGVHFSHRAH